MRHALQSLAMTVMQDRNSSSRGLTSGGGKQPSRVRHRVHVRRWRLRRLEVDLYREYRYGPSCLNRGRASD